MSNTAIKISRVRINNILGIDELEFDAGRFNEFAGPNGAGKTSVLEAIKSVFQTGHDATLLRHGAEQGEVVLLLDDGSALRRRVKASASDTAMKRDGKLVQRPVENIRAMLDALSLNPIEFLRASHKDRARVLLESMPLQIDRSRLAEIVGRPLVSKEEAHPLVALDAEHRAVYDLRTGANRAVREKENTIKQFQAAMPEEVPGASGDDQQILTEIARHDAERDKEMRRIAEKLGGIEDRAAEAKDKLRTEAQARIDAIKAELEKAIDAEQAELDKIRSLAAQQREATISAHTNAVGPLRSALAAISANRDAATKRRVALETIDTMQSELQTLSDEAGRLDAAVRGIEAYRSELLESLPIPGVEIVGGEVLRGGIPFDRLNTAQQVSIAVDIARLRAGKLGVVCVDGIELLDPASYEEFRRQAIESGLQLFVSRVSDSDEMQVSISDQP